MQIGRYRVLGELGRGAMGIVYRAQDPKIGRIIAIKSIRLNELTDPEERSRLRDRLFREAQSAGMLSHPNIVTIYDILEENDLAYIFMEFVNGMPLDDMLRSDSLPSGHVLISLLSQTANALDYAHRKGIIHRDIKPANVMVHEDSVAKVCDFGIAKITSQSMTQTGVVMGTPSYMSPELIKGETLTGASDQFALAIMAYEILTGQKPFKADYLPTLFFKVCSDEPPAVHELNPTLTPLVDRAVRKALAKKPDERYATCAEFMKTLERAMESTPDWIPLAKRPLPVTEESTTGSGGRVAPQPAQDATTIDPSLARPAAPVAPAPPSPEPTGPAIPAQPQQQPPVTQAPFVPPTQQQPIAPPPQPQAPPPSVGSTTGRNLPSPPMQIPVREEPPAPPPSQGGMSKVLIGGVVVAVLAVAGYFGFSKTSAPTETQPPQEQQQPPSTPPPGASGGTGSTKPSPAPSAPAKPVPAPVPPKSDGKEAAPAKDRDYDIAFTSAPPGATVTIDGAATCKSPCSLPMKQGRHSVQFVLPGFVTTYRPLEVPSSLELTVTMPEATGVLAINSNPKGATIILDGQTRPEVTPARLTLREGPHKVDLVLGSLRDSHEVTIKQGSIQQIQSTWQ